MNKLECCPGLTAPARRNPDFEAAAMRRTYRSYSFDCSRRRGGPGPRSSPFEYTFQCSSLFTLNVFYYMTIRLDRLTFAIIKGPFIIDDQHTKLWWRF